MDSSPDLIVASSSPVIAALKQATHTIPIVFSVVNDPLGQGFVANQARPGGNITGFTFVDFPMIGNWMELLKEIDPASTGSRSCSIEALAREPGGGLIAGPDPFLNARRGVVMTMSTRHRLPVIFGFRRYVTEGALMSYGPDTLDIVQRSASYVDRILKGEKPAELPVQAPNRYELAINLKTARALGLEVPPTLLARADEVIE